VGCRRLPPGVPPLALISAIIGNYPACFPGFPVVSGFIAGKVKGFCLLSAVFHFRGALGADPGYLSQSGNNRFMRRSSGGVPKIRIGGPLPMRPAPALIGGPVSPVLRLCCCSIKRESPK